MTRVEPRPLTLLDIVMAVAEVTPDPREVSAVVAHMIRSGRVRPDPRRG